MKKKAEPAQPGKFLTQADREAMQRQRRNSSLRCCRRYMTVMVLLLWDGLLLYMMVCCLIEAIYGAVFIAVISVNLGYHLK